MPEHTIRSALLAVIVILHNTVGDFPVFAKLDFLFSSLFFQYRYMSPDPLHHDPTHAPAFSLAEYITRIRKRLTITMEQHGIYVLCLCTQLELEDTRKCVFDWSI